jgi:hypothetical protein
LEALKGKILAVPKPTSPDIKERLEEIVFEFPSFLKKVAAKYAEADKLVGELKASIAVSRAKLLLYS